MIMIGTETDFLKVDTLGPDGKGDHPRTKTLVPQLLHKDAHIMHELLHHVL